jgi:hypothetical protein
VTTTAAASSPRPLPVPVLAAVSVGRPSSASFLRRHLLLSGSDPPGHVQLSSPGHHVPPGPATSCFRPPAAQVNAPDRSRPGSPPAIAAPAPDRLLLPCLQIGSPGLLPSDRIARPPAFLASPRDPEEIIRLEVICIGSSVYRE